MTHSYDNIEDRAFEMTDVCLGPCSLVAGMVADEMVADMWENPPVDHQMLDTPELISRHIWEWERTHAACLRSMNATIWSLNIERYAS